MLGHQSVWTILVPVALAIGCQEGSSGSSIATASAPAAPSVAAIFPSGRTTHLALPRHAGISAGIFRAALDLTLTREQGHSIEKIEASLRVDDDGIRTPLRAFRSDLAAGVRAGNLDAGKLMLDDAAIDKAVFDHEDREAAELDTLHALLDPSQRVALVAAVRAKLAEREARMAGWMKLRGADGGAPDLGAKRLQRLTGDLGLDPGQQKHVARILANTDDLPDSVVMQARWDDIKKRIETLLTAFAGTTFDSKRADLTIFPGWAPRRPLDHIAALVSLLLPILHADQRDKLAVSLGQPFGSHAARGASSAAFVRHPVDDIMFPFVEPNDDAEGDGPVPPG